VKYSLLSVPPKKKRVISSASHRRSASSAARVWRVGSNELEKLVSCSSQKHCTYNGVSSQVTALKFAIGQTTTKWILNTIRFDMNILLQLWTLNNPTRRTNFGE
jgi:hypothetical protein